MKKAIFLVALVWFLTVYFVVDRKNLQANSQGFVSEKLSNGLEIVTFESSKVPLVTICLTFRAGGMTETPELNGLTHLWEHMFFKGNSKIPNQEQFQRRIRQLGITYNGDTSAEKVRYYFTLPSVFLEEGLEFMADAIRTPNLDLAELEKERVIVLNEYQRSASNPGFLSRNARRKIIYGKQEHLRDPLGKVSTIMAANKEHLDQIQREVFVPKNGAIVIGGNIKHEKVMFLAEKYFGDWKNPKDWTFPHRGDLPEFPSTKNFNFSHPITQDVKLSITYKGPRASVNPEDTFAADILIGLLTNKSGNFYNKFINSGLTYDAGLHYYTQSHAGEIVIYSHNKASKTESIKSQLLEEVNKWIEDGYFTEKQLEDVKRELLINHKMATAKPSSYVKDLGFWWAVTGLDYYGDYLSNLEKITITDVQNFIKKYLVDKKHVDTALYNTEEAKKLNVDLNGNDYVKENLKEYL